MGSSGTYLSTDTVMYNFMHCLNKLYKISRSIFSNVKKSLRVNHSKTFNLFAS